MGDTTTYSAERPKDYRQKIRDYAIKKKKKPKINTGAVRGQHKSVYDFVNY